MRRLFFFLCLASSRVLAADAPVADDGFEALCGHLAEARCRVADLSLRAMNPFVSPEGRAACAAERAEAEKDLLRYRTEYALVIVDRPSVYEARHEEVPDEIKYPAKAYEAVLTLKNGLTLSAIVDAAKSHGSEGAVSAAEFSDKVLAAASPGGNAAFAETQKVVAELKPRIPKVSDETAALVAQVVSLVPAFTSTTGDQEMAEELLTLALRFDPTVPALWALRSKTRLTQGRSGDAQTDLIVAASLNQEDKDTQESFKRYYEVPTKVDALYLEGCNEVDSTGALFALTFGRDCQPFEERGALAHYRNHCRRLFACSFIGNPATRSEALKWALVEGKDAARLRPNALTQAGPRFADAISAANGDGRRLLKTFDDHAPLMAANPNFWEFRARLLLGGFHETAAATAAVDVGEALDPSAKWVPELRAEIAKQEGAAK